MLAAAHSSLAAMQKLHQASQNQLFAIQSQSEVRGASGSRGGREERGRGGAVLGRGACKGEILATPWRLKHTASCVDQLNSPLFYFE